MPELALETVGLTMRFGGVVAANNVNFRLETGELRCLIGPNGAGKSTFFKCITGLQAPTEGEVYMRGEETTRWMPHEIASLGVGIKTQTPNVMDSLSVQENIWLAARRFHNPRNADRKAQEIVDLLELRSISKNVLSRLAHGERQRVELGLVAAADPWLVLLDEPAAGLSNKEVQRMTEIIRQLNQRAALVIVEHDMQFIRSIAETVTVFHQGKVLIEDHVDQVMADPMVRSVYLGKKP